MTQRQDDDDDDDDDIVETLIDAVKRRELLYNYKLASNENRKEVTRNLWEEVSEELEGKMTALEAKQRFKSLRDRFVKLSRAESREYNENATKRKRKRWPYYKRLDFLSEYCEARRSASDAPPLIKKIGSTTTESGRVSPNTPIGSQRKRRPKNVNETLEKIMEAVNKPLPVFQLQQESGEQTEVDAFATLASEKLKKFDVRTQRRAMFQITKFLFELEEKFCN